jgi:potassium efflux system protein
MLRLLKGYGIGLLGYNNLAWSLSRYQAHFLLLIALYVLTRGLLIDALELLSEWMIASLYNGWLWIEVFLKPLDKLLRLSLFLGMVFAFLKLLEFYSGLAILAALLRFSETLLVNVPGIHITVKSVIGFSALVMLLIWVAKWTREFCFRCVYKNTRDVGIRNSFSVFTQYAVIIVGVFIAFRVLGFDFTGLSLVLGGLAVGMGFGLRDFASNIVGGLMLLIERPVREGDLVTIGDYEGRVAHIGIRSMRVSSWDNMEVLIPNAETFNKPFTNWTHQDSVVRTIVPIKVSRQDSPEQVQALILKILMQTPEILVDPVPHVFLTQIDEALIAFEARYFINVDLHTRFEVRSKVLFAVTDAFKAAGIKAPIPPLQVELSGEH